MLSNYFSTLGNDYGIKIDNINKLVPNLGNKSKDVHRYRSLQLYLSLGMELAKVYRILGFKKLCQLKKIH